MAILYTSTEKRTSNRTGLNIYRLVLFFTLSFFFFNNSTGQPCLLVHQLGVAKDSVTQLFVFDSQELASKKINDSTWAFDFKPAQPAYLFVVINSMATPMWKTRVWIFPEQGTRELFINYTNHSVKLKDESPWDKITDEFVTLLESGKGEQADQVGEDFVNKNPDSFLSLWFLTHGLYREKKNLKRKAFLTLSPALETYPDYNQLKKSLLPRGSPKVGDAFEEFTLNNLYDSVFTSQVVSDKWILLHFWSNQCAPCVKEMDSIVSFYNSIDTSKVAFISVALDNQRDKWKNSSATKKIKWVSLWEDDNFNGDLSRHYNVDVLPYFIIFDKDKKVNLITFGNELELVKSTLKAVK